MTAQATAGARTLTYREALREALRDALSRDHRVFLMGRMSVATEAASGSAWACSRSWRRAHP